MPDVYSAYRPLPAHSWHSSTTNHGSSYPDPTRPTMSFQDYIEEHQQELIDRLAEVVAIPSVSGDASYRQ